MLRENKSEKTWAMHPIFHNDSKTGSEMALNSSEHMIRSRVIVQCVLLYLHLY